MKIEKLTPLLSILACLLASDLFAQNLASSQSWTVSSGSIGIFNQNGTTSQNVREPGIGPDGNQVILWKGVPDAANSSDGGWDTQVFPIDRTKMYRFSVWIKKTNSNDGHTYFGCGSDDILDLTGSVNPNPYFFVGDLPELNKWYLLVGYVHASTDPSTSHYGGIYDGVTGARVVDITDFKFSTTSTIARHRTYLYYDTNTSDTQYFYGPEVYQLTDNVSPVETARSSYVNGIGSFGKKVGIGTLNPAGTLHIHANTPEVYLTTNDWAAIRGNAGMWLLGYGGTAGSEDISIGTQSGNGSRTLTLAAGGYGRMKILSNGNVGIGTTTPDEKLTVSGTIHSTRVKVDVTVPGPDYVFEEEYNLLSLEEIKKYIDAHKHLPEVPSAKQMEKNGIDVVEMNMLLLKKIEELTLHMIELKKENEQQQQKIDLQEKQISTLTNKK